MNGETVKYHYYDSNKRSFITIPVSLARAKNWGHGDKIGILSHIHNGIEGYFIWNRKDDKDES